MSRFIKLFPKKHNLIAMIHVDALPGTPLHRYTMDEIATKACKETEAYLRHNVDGLLIENMHDIPYVQSRDFQPDTVACLARICTEVKKITPPNLPIGLQVLAAGNKEAIAIAKACSLSFIRSEGFVFGHVADEGYIDANAGTLLRYRKNIKADEVQIYTDIKKKHSSHAITSDISLTETAKAAEFFLSDAVILSGISTGFPVDTEELKEVKRNCGLPVFIGSGVTSQNLSKYREANAFIVGSNFKKDGLWMNELDETRIKNFMEKLFQL